MSDSRWVVETEGLTRRFGSFTAVDGVTFRVEPGSIFGFLGPTGSGKSTVIRMLCGLLKPSAGRASVNGHEVDREPEAVRQSIGYMAQRFSLYSDMTVRENWDFFGGIYGLASRPLAERIETVLAQLDLAERADELTASLPLGWKQRVALGAAILHEPPVLFLDEPTSGVDPASRRLFWAVLDELIGRGTTIFVSTHTMEEGERCGQVGIMYAGRLIALDSPKGLKDAFHGALYAVEADPLLDAQEAAQKIPMVEDAALFGTVLHLTLSEDAPERVRKAMEAGGMSVRRIERIPPTLEDVFVQAIVRSQREGKSPSPESPATEASSTESRTTEAPPTESPTKEARS